LLHVQKKQLVIGTGHIGTISGPSWPTLGPSWDKLGAAWGHLGLSWGHLGPSQGHLGLFVAIVVHLGKHLKLEHEEQMLKIIDCAMVVAYFNVCQLVLIWHILGLSWAMLAPLWPRLGAC
jgi:hypothetical protein